MTLEIASGARPADDALIVTLWTRAGGRRGHVVRLPIVIYDHPRGAAALEATLRTLLRLWWLVPSLATAPRQPSTSAGTDRSAEAVAE